MVGRGTRQRPVICSLPNRAPSRRHSWSTEHTDSAQIYQRTPSFTSSLT